MALLRSSNPTLSDKTFQDMARPASLAEAMTLNGTVNKTGFLLLLVIITAGWSWSRLGHAENPAELFPLLIGSAIGGFVLSLVIVFKKEWSPLLSPVYALLEGVVLGVISAIYEQQFHGIVFQAVFLTFGTLFALLLAYRSGVIRATENFKLGVVAATGAIGLLYLTGFVLSFFSIQIPYIHGSGVIGIGFSLFVVVIAALNLVLDFDFIEQGVAHGAPKYMEWYGGFALLVTLIWLYLEILRLLSKLRSRR
jgi:uncharacterized YccA/Bax inhibitor family protein